MKLLIACVLLATYTAFCYCQSVPEARSINKMKFAKELLEGNQPLYLFRAVHPSYIWTGNNTFICWTSKRTDVIDQRPPHLKQTQLGVPHNITYYNVTQSGSTALDSKLGAWTVRGNMVTLQTRNRDTQPKIRSEWPLVEAQQHCMVLGKHINTNNAICLYWASPNSEIENELCEAAYKNNCSMGFGTRYDMHEKCDEKNVPKKP
uniref:Uncharacterized protein n=1 Tax=Rhipicephalus pulchellus TaxID=72859 RepID=L7LVM5_RHIPC